MINAEKSGLLSADLYTGLPAGTYCDVIFGNYDNGSCTGDVVQVDSSGNAHFEIDATSNDPVVAIHIGECVSLQILFTTFCILEHAWLLNLFLFRM